MSNVRSVPTDDIEVTQNDIDISPEEYYKGKGDKSVPNPPRDIEVDEEDGSEEKLLAGKFSSPDELEKAYNELQKRFTQDRQAEGQTDTGSGQEEEDDTDVPEDAKVDDIKIDEPQSTDIIKEAESEFLEKGQLSEDTYSKLSEKMGLSKEYVDTYIEGVRAKSSQHVSTLFKVAGGQSNLNKATEWAKANYSDSERAEFNEALKSGNTAAMKFAIKTLMHDYNKGKDPIDISKSKDINKGKETKVSNIYSLSDLTDKEYDRYIKDPKYRDYINKQIL